MKMGDQYSTTVMEVVPAMLAIVGRKVTLSKRTGCAGSTDSRQPNQLIPRILF